MISVLVFGIPYYKRGSILDLLKKKTHKWIKNKIRTPHLRRNLKRRKRKSSTISTTTRSAS